jgi:hypothetical protein
MLGFRIYRRTGVYAKKGADIGWVCAVPAKICVKIMINGFTASDKMKTIKYNGVYILWKIKY